MQDETLAIALIVFSATAAQLLAVRWRVPAIIPLLVVGVVLGPYVIDVVDPDELLGSLLQPIVNLAVAVILFEGSLSLRREHLAEPAVRKVVSRLVSVGVLTTWALATLGAALFLGIDIRVALILGAILTLSGPTVVLPLLDFVMPNRRLGTILRWEGILIDPIGAIIAVLTFQAVSSGTGDFNVGGFALTTGVGIGCGLAGAALLGWVLRDAHYSHALKSAATLGLVLAVAAAASGLREDAGLVAAVTLGVALANGFGDVIAETKLFAETLVGLLIGALFIMLSALVDPGAVVDLGWGGVAFIALLVLVTRPLTAALCTVGSGLERRERAFLGWMMPRGIVAAATVSAFQLELVEDGIPDAEILLPATFAVIAATVAIYGLTGRPVADGLGVRQEPD